MSNKKKKIISTLILLVSLFAILLGSMDISSNFNKDVNIKNIDSGSEEGEIGVAGCKIHVKNHSGEELRIHDGDNIIYNTFDYTCKKSICYVEYTKVNSNFKGLAGDGNCGTGVRTTGKKVYCTTADITPEACYYTNNNSTTSPSTTNKVTEPEKVAPITDVPINKCKKKKYKRVYWGISSNKENIECTTAYYQTDKTYDSGTRCSSSSKNSYGNYDIYELKYYDCLEKVQEPVTTPKCNIKVSLAPGESYTIYDNGDEPASWSNTSSERIEKSYNCSTNDCFAKITSKISGRNYLGLAGDGNCGTGPRTSEDRLSCKDGTTSVDIKACYQGDTSGGGGGTYIPIPEPTVDKNTTVKKEAFFYAKGNEYQGKSIKCGDKIYITECTNDNDSICNVISINGTSVSNTKIRFSNVTPNEKDTGCYQEIKRYIAKKTSYYTNRELNSGKTDISCGEIVTFKQNITTACVNKSCEVVYNNKTIYINIDDITSDKPACQNQDETKTCETSKKVTNAKGDVTVSICKNDDTEDTRNKIVSCAEDYEFKYKLTNDTCKDSNSDNCYKDYLYTCSYIKRPGVNASAGVVGSNGKGIITVTGVPYGNIGILGYHVSSGEEPTVNSNWSTFNAVNNSFSIERTAGTYFIWAINNKRRISYPVLAKVYDADLSTTLASFKVQDENGNDINTNISSLDGTVGYTTGVKDSKYALLSNDLIADSIGGFDKLTTSYELSVNSNKIALYATLTSSDATYVSGYEPRTIDLDYGRNVALIKIVNKDGKERCYTFIINRVDDRNNSNLLKNVKLSRGSIDFDPYTTNYDVKISRFTKKVSVNAELDSSTSTFIKGYEPREVEITEDRQSVVLKVISEAGSIRSYVITFIRNGEDNDTSNSTYLSSLTVPGTMLGFDKETYDYTITVPYETEDLPIYAFAESETASVTVGNNTGLKVGNNLIQIEVKNNNKTRIYSLHVIRKESGLDISDSAKLGTLSIKNYNIEFSPDKLDYEVKIKREKTLLISATPESNRADIYMYGNNDLTGFSTIRVKVIAENGLTNIYSIDIQKAAYNKKIEIIASVAGVSALLIVSLVIYLKKKNNKRKEYLEG